ncbi:Site-specific recombinase XerD [Chryseobacterium wanjuense]|uniref:Site-specific recombinase XerD n=1 Tax=Chryseobacterium wanjuense TaxID=356305 RepID=A0A1I0S6C7_9FLAO|nr:site-specific integrase [Chryseobacterium wanjuense]SEW49589.1 Site-specific recombinase XerD [Chryseobacterium wanjuense]
MNNHATIKVVMGSKPLSDGQYLVYLRITKNRRKKEISIGLKGFKEHFDSEQFIKPHPNFKIENSFIIKQKYEALSIIRNFQLNDEDFTLESFERKFRGMPETNDNFFDFTEEIITEMEQSDRLGNARAYREAKESLLKFINDNHSGKTTLKFKELTPELLEKYEVYMRSKGNENGGMAFKMRQIRAIFNKAINRKIISQDIYPFKYYKVSKLKAKPNKRALTVEDFKKLKDVNLLQFPHLMEAYNYFMFSFYTRGMNFVDMMYLKKSDIVNDRLYYTRAKTKGRFNIEIVDKAQEIIDFYKDKTKNTSYVFPILLSDDMTPKQIEYRKHKVLSRYNRKLGEIAKIAGVESHVTSYVARHSFATILKKKGTSTDLISELMGHSNVQITMTYLKEFDDEELDNANRRLLDL